MTPEEWESTRQRIITVLEGFQRVPAKDGSGHWMAAREETLDDLKHAVSEMLEWKHEPRAEA